MVQQTTNKPLTNALAITPDNQVQVIQDWSKALVDLTNAQHTSLSQVEKDFGVSIITNLTTRCIKAGIKANELNLTNFLEQVKHYSKLQLSINENELYLDIRNDKDTGLKNVTISRQYFGIQKLMMRYCKKKIVRFLDGIICTGDDFVMEEDFNLCVRRVVKHTKNNTINRNSFANIEGAYVIALVEEYGQLVPYTCVIDKNRLWRAKNAAQTDKIWTSDTASMCLKSAYWSMWKMMKPYIELPLGLQESFVATEDEMDWDKPPIPVNTDLENTIYDIPAEEEQQPIIDVAPIEESTEMTKEETKPTPKENTESETRERKREPYVDRENIYYVTWQEYKEHKDNYEFAGTYDKENHRQPVYKKYFQ